MSRAAVAATVFAAPEPTHRRINDSLGQPDDPATAAPAACLAKVIE